MITSTLFDFDQEFTTSSLAVVNAIVELDSNSNNESRIDAEVADQGQSNWASVGYTSFRIAETSGGGALKSGITFFVPGGKKWRIHNTLDPVSINGTDVAYILHPEASNAVIS